MSPIGVHTNVSQPEGHESVVNSSYFVIIALISFESVTSPPNFMRAIVHAFLSISHEEMEISSSPRPLAAPAPNLVYYVLG